MLSTLTCESFTEHLNQVFRIHAPHAVVDAELIEAKCIGSHNPEECLRQAFSLVFRSTRGEVFEQGTFRVECEGFGEADLFLVPIGHDDDGPRYEVIFG